MNPINRLLSALMLVVALNALVCGAANAQQEAQTIVHLLDYIGVDYPGAVDMGKVKDESEYKEMLGFAVQIVEQIKGLPDTAGKSALVGAAETLAKQIAAKTADQAITESSGKLRWALIGAYRLQVVPRRAPDSVRAATLYSQQCTACHGAQGRGDGPDAKGLDPAPANFHNAERMASRSAYGMYNTISLGVAGTAMKAFATLSEEDRWALAFYVSNLGVPTERISKAQALWKSGEGLSVYPDLANVATRSNNEIRQEFGDKAALIQEYLRAHPEAVAANRPSPIAFSRQRVADALIAFEKGDYAAARQFAVVAYLEGFELAESGLDNVDHDLRLNIEREMLALRNALGSRAPIDSVRNQVRHIDALLSTAEEKLGGGGLSPTAAFVSALIILLREGLEAILLLAAIIAYVTKTGRRDALVWVHAGWMIALVLGAVTWLVATYFIGISGANRELTEGVTALIASAMLLYVGYWLHGRSQAQAWSRFLREQVGAALEKKTLWAMASVSFLAVYREMFEVVLFYEALWVQAGDNGHQAVAGGIAAAAVLLAVTGWGIFKYSLRLPLGPFFSVMSLLLALMAVAFAGQGIAGLQEAGLVEMNTVNFITVPMLGIHPTIESLGAQVLALALVALGYWATRRKVSA